MFNINTNVSILVQIFDLTTFCDPWNSDLSLLLESSLLVIAWIDKFNFLQYSLDYSCIFSCTYIEDFCLLYFNSFLFLLVVFTFGQQHSWLCVYSKKLSKHSFSLKLHVYYKGLYKSWLPMTSAHKYTFCHLQQFKNILKAWFLHIIRCCLYF